MAIVAEWAVGKVLLVSLKGYRSGGKTAVQPFLRGLKNGTCWAWMH